jgi:hypothetical protein
MTLNYIPASFFDYGNDNDYFDNAGEMLKFFFAENDAGISDVDLWHKIQDMDGFDPLRTVQCDYRPFDKKWIYYGDKMGLISHPRYEVMKHLLPWYWNFTVMELLKKMNTWGFEPLKNIIEVAERDWFRLPLNAKFIANLNLWRTAIYLSSESAKQLSLF